MMIIDRNGKQISGVFFVLVLFFLRPPSSAACCFRPLPEGGATGAAPIGSRAVVEALVHQLLFLRLGSSWSRVWWRVAPEAGPGPGSVLVRPLPAAGCSGPPPAGGARRAATISSSVGVERLVHQLLILTSGRQKRVWCTLWFVDPSFEHPWRSN